MISSSGNQDVFENKQQRKYLGKTLVKDREWKPIQISQIPIFFDFSKTQKQERWNLFGSKTLLKTCLNTKQTLKIFLSKVLSKQPKRWGIYTSIRKLAVRLMWQPDRLTVDRPGRPPMVRIVTVGQPRSTGTVDPNKQRALLSARSTVPVDRPSDSKRAQICARRSTGPVDHFTQVD